MSLLDLFKVSTVTETKENTVILDLIAACGVKDRANEVMDYVTSKPNFEAWSKEQQDASNGVNYGNVRPMHNPHIAAGMIIEPMVFDDEKEIIRARVEVVDPIEVMKCRKGIYTGASVGGKYLKKWYDHTIGATRYTALVNELSLADRSSQPDAKIELMKNRFEIKL